MKAFLKATVIGGVLFLLPLALVLLVLGHAMRFAAKIAEPIVERFGLDAIGHFAGVGAVTITAAIILVFLSFAAGIAARTAPGRRVSQWFESSILGSLPQYQLVKSMAEGLTQIEGANGFKPVLVSVEDGWQLGYLLERLSDGWVAVFLPQSPTPMSGNIMYFPAQRVRPLDISMIQATALVKRLGAGSAEALRDADLRLPQAN